MTRSQKSWIYRIMAVGAAALALPTVLGASAAGAPGSRPANSSVPLHCGPSHPPDLPSTSPWRQNGWLSAQNEALSARIVFDQFHLTRSGVEITQWGPDSRTGKIKVYLRHYSPAAARAVYALYRCAVIVARNSESPPTFLGRDDNTSPPGYVGGDYIWIPSTSSQCTGGPIVLNDSGQYRMLTAGHCVSDIGDFVYRSDLDNGIIQTDGPHMGDVTQRSLCTTTCVGIDAAVVDNNAANSQYSPTVWGGGDSGVPAYAEDGTAFPDPANCPNGVPGCAADLVTNDSAVTGELAGLPVQAVNQVFCTKFGSNGQCMGGANNLSQVYTSSNSIVAHDGDSGGPWIVREGTSGNAKIAGITDIGTHCNAGACQAVYYQQIGGILSLFDESVP